jgi:hypothetical protein
MSGAAATAPNAIALLARNARRGICRSHICTSRLTTLTSRSTTADLGILSNSLTEPP